MTRRIPRHNPNLGLTLSPNMVNQIWWQAKESKWPALAKMVKQYFAAPASSAGVERVFSAVGKMHGDLQKSAKDSTLDAD